MRQVTNPALCNVVVLPVVTKDLRIYFLMSPLSGFRLSNFYRDASSALLQLVNQWLNFTYFTPVLTLSAT